MYFYLSIYAQCILYSFITSTAEMIPDMVLAFPAGVIESIAVSCEGALFCSVGDDQAMKVFDVVNFDMINMLKLG